jgi:hypothetical protein
MFWCCYINVWFWRIIRQQGPVVFIGKIPIKRSKHF